MKLVVFEDQDAHLFHPIAVSHPVFDLFYGCFNPIERLRRHFQPSSISLICREYLAEVARHRYNVAVNEPAELRGDCLLVNAALVPSAETYNGLLAAPVNTAFYDGDTLLGGRIGAEAAKSISAADVVRGSVKMPSGVRRGDVTWPTFNYLWEIVNRNGVMIEFDLPYLNSFDVKLSGCYLHPSVALADGVFVDANGGPVVIDEGAVVQPRSLIQGPAYIGKGTAVLGGMVREGCSFGPACKVGGELEETVIMGYSNKAHEGFIGHSYIGEWVNLGALTTNSDLKNNYSNITVRLNGRNFDTGSIKVGSFIGDHTKTGIGTLLNTGIVVGFSCNLYGGLLFADKEIRHFSWGTPDNMVEFNLDKATEVARRVMARRDVEFSLTHKGLFEYIHAL